MRGVTAAAVILRRALVDVPTVLIALITLGVLLRFKEIPEPILIVAAGVARIVIHRGA